MTVEKTCAVILRCNFTHDSLREVDVVEVDRSATFLTVKAVPTGRRLVLDHQHERRANLSCRLCNGLRELGIVGAESMRPVFERLVLDDKAAAREVSNHGRKQRPGDFRAATASPWLQ